jgi:hypothetical protein
MSWPENPTRPEKTSKKERKTSGHKQTIPQTLVKKGYGKILHMLLIIGRHTKKNLSTEAVGACLESSRLPQIVVKKPSRSKKSKTPCNDALSTPETKPKIFSHTAYKETQISNISRNR